MAITNNLSVVRPIFNCTTNPDTITLVAVSDIHGTWKSWDMTWQEPELGIIAGDIFGTDVVSEQEAEFPEFIEKCQQCFPSVNEFLIVPGNHDFWIERIYRQKLSFGYGVRVLVDSGYTYESWYSQRTLKIWGDPRTECGMFAFQRYPGVADLGKIPKGLDILVTHDSPRNYKLSCIRESIGDYGFEEPGCLGLAKRVEQVKPRIHLFGHIHKPCHYETEDTKYFNVSLHPVMLTV